MKRVLNLPGYGRSTLGSLSEGAISGTTTDDSERRIFFRQSGKTASLSLALHLVECADTCASVNRCGKKSAQPHHQQERNRIAKISRDYFTKPGVATPPGGPREEEVSPRLPK